MKVHANAPLGPKGRQTMVRRVVEQGWSVTEAAEGAGVSDRTCSKWVARYRQQGEAGLHDRSSAPQSVPHRTPDELVELIAALRQLRMTGAEIALCLAMALSTVSAVLTRIGLGKLSRLEPPEPPNRYERRQAGELLHIDVKKLGRIRGGAGHRMLGRGPGRHAGKGAGWDYVHVCVDDATRLAYVEVLADEQASTVVAFLRRAIAFYRRHGISVERVMTDNGSGYRSALHAVACRALGVRHLRTRPYRPRTNGKAERFIRTMLGGWAYGAIYASSAERTAALDGWLWTYNHRRPHGALNHKPPIARLHKLNNLAGSYN
ncbi:MAG: IS481 family transposase [Actinomycetota bacterium]|nr:IS481 family transposase [Actinomycetota bacterium]